MMKVYTILSASALCAAAIGAEVDSIVERENRLIMDGFAAIYGETDAAGAERRTFDLGGGRRQRVIVCQNEFGFRILSVVGEARKLADGVLLRLLEMNSRLAFVEGRPRWCMGKVSGRECVFIQGHAPDEASARRVARIVAEQADAIEEQLNDVDMF